MGLCGWGQGTNSQPESRTRNVAKELLAADGIFTWNKQWVFSGIGVLALSGLGSVIRFAFRGRRPGGDGAGTIRNPEPSVSESVKSATTGSIPVSTQTLNLSFDTGGSSPPLTMMDGKKARAEIHLAWKVVNPYLFCFSSNGHPFDVLVPLLLARTRELMESLKLDDARSRRRESETRITEILIDDFGKRGIKIESVLLGAVEELGR